jgi:predicted small secreted protein
MRKALLPIAALVATSAIVAGCASDAQIASQNLSRSADMFEIERRIVFYNGITDSYMLEIQGRCSIHSDNADQQLEVTCKIGEDRYNKHFLGLSDNVTYFAEQVGTADVSVYHYRVIFKPQTILPDVDFRADPRALVEDLAPDGM